MRVDRAAFAAGLLMLSRFVADALTSMSQGDASVTTSAETVVATVFALGLGALLVLRCDAPVRWTAPLRYFALASLVWMCARGAPATSEAVKEISRWLTYMVVFAGLTSVCRTRHSAIRVLRVLTLGAVAQGALGLLQFILGTTVLQPAGSAVFRRVSGTFLHPGWYGLFLGLMIVVAWFVPSVLGKSRGAGLAVMGSGLLLSWSRGAWVFCVVAVVVMALVERRPRRVAALTGVVAVAAFVPAIRSRLGSELADGSVTGSLATRLFLRDAAWDLFAQAPLTGHGTGYFFSVEGPRLVGMPYETHNDVLKVLADTGLVGLALVMGLLLSMARLYWRASGGGPLPHVGFAILCAMSVLFAIDTVTRLNSTVLLAVVALAACAGPVVPRRTVTREWPPAGTVTPLLPRAGASLA